MNSYVYTFILVVCNVTHVNDSDFWVIKHARLYSNEYTEKKIEEALLADIVDAV